MLLGYRILKVTFTVIPRLASALKVFATLEYSYSLCIHSSKRVAIDLNTESCSKAYRWVLSDKFIWAWLEF